MQRTRCPSLLETGRVLFLPTVQIRPNPQQPRKNFDPAGLQELSQSISEYGVLQPLTVRRKPGFFELVAGERRLRAARMAGLGEVPCIVISADEEASGMLAMVENLQRRDLDFIEQAQGLQKLMQDYQLSQEQAARRLGLSQSAVANKLRLLRHSPEVLQRIREAGLTERHARALLRLNSDEQRLAAVTLIAARGWTVARTEEYIDSLLAAPAPEPEKRELGAFRMRSVQLFFNSVEHQLQLIRTAGIPACREKLETDREIVLTIRIPK